MALASLGVHLAETALDYSVLLPQTYLGLGLTGRNRSNRRGLPPAAAADLVVVSSLGFAEAGKPCSAGCVADL